jgi:hypothetical protein
MGNPFNECRIIFYENLSVNTNFEFNIEYLKFFNFILNFF